MEVLAALDITPRKPAAETSVLAAQTWATIEDQGDVVETVVLKGLPVEEDESSDSEEQQEDDEDVIMGNGALSHLLAPLENYAARRDLNEASYLLERTRMLMIEAHASKPSRQADINELFTRRAMGRFASRNYCCSLLVLVADRSGLCLIFYVS